MGETSLKYSGKIDASETQHLHSRVMSLELRWCTTSEFSPVRMSFQLIVFS